MGSRVITGMVVWGAISVRIRTLRHYHNATADLVNLKERFFGAGENSGRILGSRKMSLLRSLKGFRVVFLQICQP
jgi:hypothetical protein